MGDSKEEVKTKLESMLLDYEDETALMYLEETDSYEYYLDVYFEEDKLSSIDVMVYYYNEDGSLDLEASKELYEGWKAALTSKLGKTDEITEADDTYSAWVDGNKEFNVGADDQRAYYYLYPY